MNKYTKTYNAIKTFFSILYIVLSSIIIFSIISHFYGSHLSVFLCIISCVCIRYIYYFHKSVGEQLISSEKTCFGNYLSTTNSSANKKECKCTHIYWESSCTCIDECNNVEWMQNSTQKDLEITTSFPDSNGVSKLKKD